MERIISAILTLFFILLQVLTAFAQEENVVENRTEDTTNVEKDKNSLLPIPVVYYTPESGLFFGASLLYNFYIDRKKPINPSQIQLAGGYTTKDQLLIFIPFQLFWNQNQWRSVGELGFYNYAYPFYGIGNESSPDRFSTYRALFPRLRFFYSKKSSPIYSLEDGIGWKITTLPIGIRTGYLFRRSMKEAGIIVQAESDRL